MTIKAAKPVAQAAPKTTPQSLPPTAPAAAIRELAVAALDCGSLAVLILGPNLAIEHANRAAAALLIAGRAFSNHRGRLSLNRNADQVAINAAVTAATSRGEPGLLHLTNRQGDITHLLSITPVDSRVLDSGGLDSGGLAITTIAELRGPLLLPEGWTRSALSLPANYAELAEALAAGENLAEFAERTGLTVGGSRTRLKKLLRRLGTRSQSDLVSMVLRSAAAITCR